MNPRTRFRDTDGRAEALSARAVTHSETSWITMSDGVRLAARTWIPSDAANRPVPAILEYLPYRRRDGTRIRDEGMHPWFARAGYASLRVDIRGSGDSGGVLRDEYLQQELDDACEVISWIASQPWCDGSVGMMGKSWGAYNSFQVAAMKPPALQAIISVMGTDDRWAECIHFSGGVLLNDNFWWGSVMQILNALPPDPAVVGEEWREIWATRLKAMDFWPKIWLEHQTRDSYWKHGSISENYNDIQVPVYFFGGWADLYRDTPFRIAQHLEVPYKVLIGPWAHLYPHQALPEPKVDFVAEALRWWDRWLKGIENGVMDEPRLRFYLQESVDPLSRQAMRLGKWVEEKTWPSRNIKDHVFWLNSAGLDGIASPDGPVMSVSSPSHYGMAAGDLNSFANPGDQPTDQRIDQGGALSFSTKPVDSELEILGQPAITLRLSVDQPQAFVAAVLVDESPDGTQTLITRGFFNLMHRDGPEKPKPITSDQIMQIDLKLHGIGWRLAPAHILILRLSSTYWPICFPSPTPVTLSLEPGQSAISLPVRVSSPGDPSPRPFPDPPNYEPDAVTELRAGGIERTVSLDLTDGTVTHHVHQAGGFFLDSERAVLDDIGTQVRHVMDRSYTIHQSDPLSARLVMDQIYELTRDEWDVRTVTHSEMTANETEFLLDAFVESWDAGELLERVDWSYTVPRNGM